MSTLKFENSSMQAIMSPKGCLITTTTIKRHGIYTKHLGIIRPTQSLRQLINPIPSFQHQKDIVIIYATILEGWNYQMRKFHNNMV